LFEVILDIIHSLMRNFRNMKQAILTGQDTNEGAKIHNLFHQAFIGFTYFNLSNDILDELNGFLRGRAITSGDIDLTVVVNVNFASSNGDDFLNDFSTGTNDFTNLIHRNANSSDSGCKGGECFTRRGNRL